MAADQLQCILNVWNILDNGSPRMFLRCKPTDEVRKNLLRPEVPSGKLWWEVPVVSSETRYLLILLFLDLDESLNLISKNKLTNNIITHCAIEAFLSLRGALLCMPSLCSITFVPFRKPTGLATIIT